MYDDDDDDDDHFNFQFLCSLSACLAAMKKMWEDSDRKKKVRIQSFEILILSLFVKIQ